MTRVLGLVGSPREHGNTHLLVSALLEGARVAGAQTEAVLLRSLTIRDCDGCHLCWEQGRCSKADDMLGLYPRLAASDVIVFGTPVYWYGPTALIKACLDRFVYFNCPEHRPQIRGKSAALVVPFEEASPETAAPLVAMFEKSLSYLEMHLVATLLVAGVTRRGEVRERPEQLARAAQIGKRLVRG
jgi:multimeric flavodoxin WrbA